jgi:hypothetical protein
MLHYVAGIRPEAEATLRPVCSYVLWQRNSASERVPPSLEGLTRVWEGSRRAEHDERFFLFRRPQGDWLVDRR